MSTRDPRRKSQPSLLVGTKFCVEPKLRFAGNRLHVDPKAGLSAYGPASLGEPRHPALVRIGFVGSGKSVASARQWFVDNSPGVEGEAKGGLPDFPGYGHDRGFFSDLAIDDHLTELLTTRELSQLKQVRLLRDRYDATVSLLADKLSLLRKKDERPHLVVLALPDEIVRWSARVKYADPDRGTIYRNLRRSLKATLMQYDIPTQILLQRVTEATPRSRNVDHLSRVAWNLFTGMFFKAGGIPWRPHGLSEDTCYIGISFYRPLGSASSTMHTSVAQAFDDQGVGLVLRGPDFSWDRLQHGNSPHLDSVKAKELVGLVLERYRREVKRSPRRVVVHKTSRFWDAERDGFEEALKGVNEFDLVALSPRSDIRMVRAGDYPPHRGTLFNLGDLHFLYTTGYISDLRAYPHGHVPAPLQIADHHGDSDVSRICEEILALTKMNWNSAGFAGALPITLRFSTRVGEIMRELPAGVEPLPQFKYYS